MFRERCSNPIVGHYSYLLLISTKRQSPCLARHVNFVAESICGGPEMRARKGGSVQNKGGCVTVVILGYELAHISFCNRDNQNLTLTLLIIV